MTDTKPSLRQALRTLEANREMRPAACPSREELASYARGELAETEALRIEQHLGHCREDADFVLVLRDLASDEPAAEGDSAELEDAWRSFEARLGVQEAAHPAPPAPLPFRRSGLPAWAPPAAIAASLALAVVSTTLLVRLQSRYEAALRPHASTAIVDLGVIDEERGPGGEPRQIPLARGGSATLILHPTEAVLQGAFSLHLLDTDGREVWSGAAHPTELGTFQLSLIEAFVGQGGYVLELRREGGQVLDRFPLRFVPPRP